MLGYIQPLPLFSSESPFRRFPEHEQRRAPGKLERGEEWEVAEGGLPLTHWRSAHSLAPSCSPTQERQS
jgi:hypothetical protein